MLRIATRESLNQLRRAAAGTDVELDTALLRLGVLSPLDLEPVRAWLRTPGARLQALTNRDGHRVIAIVRNGEPEAWIHHDGAIVTADSLRRVVA